MRIGITATRTLTAAGERHIRNALKIAAAENQIEMVITGGAIGGDAFAARVATGLGLWVRTILPEDAKEIDPQWADYCDESEGGYPYRARNTRIVEQCTILFAFPAYPEAAPASKRSGTWMTVRIAKGQGREVRIWTQADSFPSTALDRPRRS